MRASENLHSIIGDQVKDRVGKPTEQPPTNPRVNQRMRERPLDYGVEAGIDGAHELDAKTHRLSFVPCERLFNVRLCQRANNENGHYSRLPRIRARTVDQGSPRSGFA